MYDFFVEDSTVDVDEAGYYIDNAFAYLEMVTDPYLNIFMEASDTPQEADMKAKTGFVESIKKAIDAIIDMIKDVISNISTFIQFQFLSAEDKDRFRKFREMVKTNPELANTKVTIIAWKRYEEEYALALKKAEDAKKIISREMADKIFEELKANVGALLDSSSDVARRAATSVTMDMALDIADQSQFAAKGIKHAMDKELINMKAVSDSLGEKKVSKFTDRINVAAKNTIWHRLKVRIFKHKTNTIRKVCRKYMMKFLSFTNVGKNGVAKGKHIIDAKSVGRGLIVNRGTVKDAMGQDGTKALGTIVKTAATAKAAEKAGKKAVSSFNKAVKRDKGFWFG